MEEYVDYVYYDVPANDFSLFLLIVVVLLNAHLLEGAVALKLNEKSYGFPLKARCEEDHRPKHRANHLANLLNIFNMRAALFLGKET